MSQMKNRQRHWARLMGLLGGLFCLIPFQLVISSDGETEYREKMNALAERCDQKKMTLEARVTRSRLWENPPYGFLVPKLPEKPTVSLPDDATSDQKEWFAEWKKIENDFGGRLLDKAKELAKEGKGFDAYRTAEMGLFINPDNEELRRIFGYQLYEGRWRRAWEMRKLEKGFLDHPKWGWVSQETAERLETLPVSTKKEGKRRVETEHFLIKTTVPQEEAAALGRHLEDFYRVWDLFFFPMNLTEKESAGIVLGKKPPPSNRHNVVFFRNRQEYLDEILALDPTGGVSSGGYFADAETIFLYIPDPDNPDETSLDVMTAHETTHQLFAESRRAGNRRKGGGAGILSHFWITEAIATYMETFRSVPNGFVIGGLESYRFLRAKERVGEPAGLLPIGTLDKMGKTEFQKWADLPGLYSESAGLASFFLHAEEGRFRAPFLDAIFWVYRGESAFDLLERLTGVTNDELDKRFRDYLGATPFE